MGHIDRKNREQSVANTRTDISGVIANNAVESIASQLRIALPSLTTIRRQGLRVAAIIAIFKAIIEDGAPVVAFVKDLFSATVA